MARRLLDSVVRHLELPENPRDRSATLLDSEWLVTNGLGGYASSTVAGANTRRYHGLLIAALPNPFGRTVMLNQLDETITSGAGEKAELSHHSASSWRITDFRLEAGLAVWHIEHSDALIERRVPMP